MDCKKRRRAVSELIGTLLMVGITLVAGAAVFAFVEGLAGNSESQYGNAVAANINSVNERFTVINVQFASGCHSAGGSCSSATVTVYNTGDLALTVGSITVTGATSSLSGVALDAVATQTGTTDYPNSLGCSTGQFSYTYATTTGTTTTVVTNTGTTAQPIPQGIVPPAIFTVRLPTGPCPQFLAGYSYQFAVLGLYGNSVSYQATASG